MRHHSKRDCQQETQDRKETILLCKCSNTADGAEARYDLQMIESGHLNAIAFWFDLHLDDEISITSAPACIGVGGEVLADAGGNSESCMDSQQPNPVKTRGKGSLHNLGRPQEAAMHPPCSYTAPDGRAGNFIPARVFSSNAQALSDVLHGTYLRGAELFI